MVRKERYRRKIKVYVRVTILFPTDPWTGFRKDVKGRRERVGSSTLV